MVTGHEFVEGFGFGLALELAGVCVVVRFYAGRRAHARRDFAACVRRFAKG
jgi:hypothetical protein